jgi:hypothetical protein
MSNESSVLPRNFTVTADERMRALIAGPPAYARRRRRIEDLEAAIIHRLRAYAETTKRPVDLAAPPAPLVRALASLRELVEAHNRYYPIEANLPIDRATGGLLDGSEPWVPMALPTLESLVARAGGAQ